MTAVEAILTEAVIDIDQPVCAALEGKGHAVHTITPDESVHRAITRMSEESIGCLVVVNQQGQLMGLISERDYCRKVILMGRNSHGTRVRDIMVTSVITVGLDASLRDVMQMMTEQCLRHVPVVHQGAIVGLLSMGDVMKWVVGEQRQTIRELRSQLSLRI